jgi:hypothetical protein
MYLILYRDTPLASAAARAEYLPPGVTGAETYAENSSELPTPRQVRDFLRKHGSAKTVALFRQFQKDSPTQLIYHQISFSPRAESVRVGRVFHAPPSAT